MLSAGATTASFACDATTFADVICGLTAAGSVWVMGLSAAFGFTGSGALDSRISVSFGEHDEHFCRLFKIISVVIIKIISATVIPSTVVIIALPV